jgi:RNA polymerase primary sigma factor
MRQLVISKQTTKRESESIDRYFTDIARIKLLSVEEEVALFQGVKDDDQSAIDKLVKANLRFVVSVAKQYQGQGLSLPDLINEGNIGLIKAVKRFDEKKGFKFISYAVWWIRQAMSASIVDKSRMIRLPFNLSTLFNKINKASSDLEQELERKPTVEEISIKADIPIDKVKHTLNVVHRVRSLDEDIDEEPESNLLHKSVNPDSLPPDKYLMGKSLNDDFDRCFTTVPNKRDVEIVRYLFGLDGREALTTEEIAYMFDVSKLKVRQIKEGVIRRLRTPKCRKILEYYR